MGSEQFDRYPGLKRRSEGAQGAPESYTVIGVDITPEKLVAKYKGSRQEGDVIAAVVQKYRTAKPPPDSFVRTLRRGIHEPIIICDLGADAKGKSWAVVVEGRQRVVGARIINAEVDAGGGGLRLDVPAVFRPFARKTAGLDAVMVKITSNARVAMTPSMRAEDALDLDARSVSHEEIVGAGLASTAEEVPLLLALAACCDEVKASVDAGVTPLADCRTLSALPTDEQARRILRKTAPSRKAADAAAPPRPRARAASLARGVADALSTTKNGRPDGPIEGVSSDAAALAAWFAGQEDALDGYVKLKKAVESAGWTAKVAT